MTNTASELARRLAENAEAVCRHYLSNGRRAGGYWLAGDVRNTPGQSLYVRLRGPVAGRGGAGKWTDAATGEHGDLLDLIAAAQGALDTGQALDEARRFLGLTRERAEPPSPAPAGSLEAVRRLWAMSKPISFTVAEIYLRERGIVGFTWPAALRFHPRCFYRPEADREPTTRQAWPALIAAVTDHAGTMTGLQRTWLDPSGSGKAPVATPRRAMGHLLGQAVRFEVADSASAKAVVVAGEGIETVLSLRTIMPAMPMAAALSAGHLAALLFPIDLRRIYIACDNDHSGQWAADRLATRAREAGIEPIVLVPQLGDFNDDLRQRGADALAAAIRVQLVPEDVARFWRPPARAGRIW